MTALFFILERVIKKDVWYTKDVAAYADVSSWTVRSWVRNEGLPTLNSGLKGAHVEKFKFDPDKTKAWYKRRVRRKAMQKKRRRVDVKSGACPLSKGQVTTFCSLTSFFDQCVNYNKRRKTVGTNKTDVLVRRNHACDRCKQRFASENGKLVIYLDKINVRIDESLLKVTRQND